MGYRCLFIANACTLSVKNNQLIVVSDIEHRVPIEDINSIVIENRSATITVYTLSELSKAGICVFLCDEKHIPCTILQPFGQYIRRKYQLSQQLNAAKPKIKRMWQAITRQKIINQGRTLLLCQRNSSDAETLFAVADTVRSGDPDNLEAQAAAHYFRILFGSDFTRSEENIINAGMNYGYAILRGYICRAIANYGFEPSIGIHHCSQVNPYNLADDFIEPFRPLVDLWVYSKINPEELALSTQIKAGLSSILNYEMISGGEKHSAGYAIERLVHSFGRCLSSEDNSSELLLPSFDALKLHEYE